jgi:hypothetical protein
MRVRRLVLAVLGSALVTVGIGGVVTTPVFAAGDANQSSCSTVTEASPGFRTFLPDCRAYELASPPYKEGAVIFTTGPAALSDDGSELLVGAAGVFAGAENFWWDGNRNPSINAYALRRTSTGWETTVLTPPASKFPHSSLFTAADGELSKTLWGLAPTTELFHENIYIRNGAGEFAEVGPGFAPAVSGEEIKSSSELSFAGASRDLRHEVFGISAFTESLLAEAHGHFNLWPGDTTRLSAPSLYEYNYAGAPAAEPTLVGVKNNAKLASNTEAELISDCGTVLGAPSEAYNAVSQTGSITFFTAMHATETGECAEPVVDEVYARINGETTIDISQPSKADCEVCDTTVVDRRPARFAGASSDGGIALFTTTQALVPGQEGANLYAFSLGGSGGSSPTGRITLVSSGSANPDVQGVARISEDGTHVYFVAKGVLTGANQAGASPVEGADNLYVFEPDPQQAGSSHNVFVATLLTPEAEERLQAEEAEEGTKVGERAEKAALAAEELALSRGESFLEALRIGFEVANQTTRELIGTLGPTGTLAADRAVWSSEDTRPVQLTDDGRFLLFLSSEPLTAGDESTVPQLFEYDALAGDLTRVSAGIGGSGNVRTFSEAPQLPVQSYAVDDLVGASSHRAISDDGARVFFTSGARLLGPEASGSRNVYEYEDGELQLISDGTDSTRAENSPTVNLFGVDRTGSNAFFLTASALVSQAAQHQVGLYDARIDGGYPAPALPRPCEGEACRGASEAAPQLTSPGSAGAAPGENAASEAISKPTSIRKPLSRRQKLLRALKACTHKARRVRAQCRRQANRRFGPVHRDAVRHGNSSKGVTR